jgi:hypothetical protein
MMITLLSKKMDLSFFVINNIWIVRAAVGAIAFMKGGLEMRRIRVGLLILITVSPKEMDISLFVVDDVWARKVSILIKLNSF